MQIKTEGIVLHLGRLNDRRMLLHLYTRTHGRVQYIIYGTGGRSCRTAMLQPLTWLRIEAQHSDTRDIQRMGHFEMAYVPQQVPTDMVRSTVAMFMAEVLYLSLRHPMEDTELFDFLTASIRQLDTCSDPENEHLRMLIGLADRLGFGIDYELPSCRILQPLLTSDVPITRTMRQQMLHTLIHYYQMHIDDFPTPKSLDVLSAVFA